MKIYIIVLSHGEYDDYRYFVKEACVGSDYAFDFKKKYDALRKDYNNHYRGRKRCNWNACRIIETELV